ncbi:MAG TPA: hypothetical protein VEB63_11900 [Chitinophagaceae bacterium]|nr:hypothetical protein [Chitinophagaceae bacterium]
MRLEALAILVIIVVSLVPVYLLNRLLQARLRPRESLARLLLYIGCGFALVFIYTFLVVFVVRKLFPAA